MLRSLHMKLVMLMVLLILSLMTVVGAFLINSVVAFFYIQDFYSQMSTVFGDQEIVSDLRTAADGGDRRGRGAEDGAECLCRPAGRGYPQPQFLHPGRGGDLSAGQLQR